MGNEIKAKADREKKLSEERWIVEQYKKLQSTAFYGEFTIVMEAGHLKRVLRKESIVPKDDYSPG